MLVFGRKIAMLAVLLAGSVWTRGGGITQPVEAVFTPTTRTALQAALSECAGACNDGKCVGANKLILSSNHNSARVQPYAYHGEARTLTWDLAHYICTGAGAGTPGSSIGQYQNKYCSYSPQDNYIVTDNCNWASQGFARVSGDNLPDGTKGLMCAHADARPTALS